MDWPRASLLLLAAGLGLGPARRTPRAGRKNRRTARTAGRAENALGRLRRRSRHRRDALRARRGPPLRASFQCQAVFHRPGPAAAGGGLRLHDQRGERGQHCSGRAAGGRPASDRRRRPQSVLPTAALSQQRGLRDGPPRPSAGARPSRQERGHQEHCGRRGRRRFALRLATLSQGLVTRGHAARLRKPYQRAGVQRQPDRAARHSRQPGRAGPRGNRGRPWPSTRSATGR